MRHARNTSPGRRGRSGMAGLVLFLVAMLVPAASVNARALVCGQILTENTTLEEDLVCEGVTGLVVGADGITVDLNGHRIVGNFAISTGISNRGGYHDVTIRNGTIYGFWAGIWFEDVSHSIIEDITLEWQADSGIRFWDSTSNVVRDNVVAHFASRGIWLQSSSHDNLVEGNTVNDAGGIRLDQSMRNRVTGNLLVANVHGIWLFDADQNEVSHNVVRNGDWGISLHYDSDSNLISANSVVDNTHVGIRIMANGTDSNHITANTIHGNGVGVSVQGDDLHPDSVQNTIDRNRIADNANAGVEVLAHTSETHVTRNRFTTNGIGIVVSDAHQTLLSKNSVSGSGHDGIVVDTGSTETELIHNRCDRNGSMSEIGDGFDVRALGTTLTKNKAFFNSGFGVAAIPGVIDGGGNNAKHNDTGQCLNIDCK